jgi:hypothetical protein
MIIAVLLPAKGSRMNRIVLRAAVASVATLGVLAVASPAQAADSAVVSCSFVAVYDSYDGSGSGLQGYAKRDDQLSVTGGNGTAWNVHVEDGFLAGHDGWIETGCVSFLS